MIEYIIFEENVNQVNIIKSLIEKIMMKKEYDYIIKDYNKYSEVLKETKNSGYFKIYILNSNTIKESGIDVAYYIRYTIDDWQSIIILQTDYKEIRQSIMNKKIFNLDFIIKDNNYEEELNKSLDISIKIFNNRPKILKYKYKNTIYNIKQQDIIYIEKEKDSKNCIIKTKSKIYKISASLNELYKQLDKYYIKCSRSYIINTKEVLQYNIKSNLIIMSDNNQITEISRKSKKELITKLYKC